MVVVVVVVEVVGEVDAKRVVVAAVVGVFVLEVCEGFGFYAHDGAAVAFSI